MSLHISPAGLADIPALVKLVNTAYRGEESRKGWASEAHLLTGNARTDEAALTEQLQTPGAVILKGIDDTGELIACVYLEKQANKLYLGMLSVLPGLQGGGIGKQLLAAATTYAQQQGCTSVIMTVISARDTLIDWYERHGYTRNGQTAPFPTDNRYGVPTQPLEFVVLEKKIM
jgi:ribosomal protein S18 acetylase RimI-like enzyme